LIGITGLRRRASPLINIEVETKLVSVAKLAEKDEEEDTVS
jgi:hypothetical protein